MKKDRFCMYVFYENMQVDQNLLKIDHYSCFINRNQIRIIEDYRNNFKLINNNEKDYKNYLLYFLLPLLA